MVLELDLHQNHLQGSLTYRLPGCSLSVCDAIVDSGDLGQLKAPKCAFLIVLGDADAAGPAITLWEPLFQKLLLFHFPLSSHPTNNWLIDYPLIFVSKLAYPSTATHHCSSSWGFCHSFLNYYNHLQAEVSSSTLAPSIPTVSEMIYLKHGSDPLSPLIKTCSGSHTTNKTVISFFSMACELAPATSPFSNTPPSNKILEIPSTNSVISISLRCCHFF